MAATTISQKAKHVFSKQFEELCYKELAYGLYKNQTFGTWYNTLSNKDRVRCSVPENTFFPYAQGNPSNFAFKLPLQIGGIFDKFNNSWYWPYDDKQITKLYPQCISKITELKTLFPQIPEFHNGAIKNCDGCIAEIIQGIIISILEIEGFYHIPCPNKNVFVLLHHLSKHSDFREKDWDRFLIGDVMNSWDWINYLSKPCNLELSNDLKIFENLFQHFGIKYNIKKIEGFDFEQFKIVGQPKEIIFEDNKFKIERMAFDDKNKIYKVNGIDLKRVIKQYVYDKTYLLDRLQK